MSYVPVGTLSLQQMFQNLATVYGTAQKTGTGSASTKTGRTTTQVAYASNTPTRTTSSLPVRSDVALTSATAPKSVSTATTTAPTVSAPTVAPTPTAVSTAPTVKHTGLPAPTGVSTPYSLQEMLKRAGQKYAPAPLPGVSVPDGAAPAKPRLPLILIGGGAAVALFLVLRRRK